jgi:hypothetical protein
MQHYKRKNSFEHFSNEIKRTRPEERAIKFGFQRRNDEELQHSNVRLLFNDYFVQRVAMVAYMRLDDHGNALYETIVTWATGSASVHTFVTLAIIVRTTLVTISSHGIQ